MTGPRFLGLSTGRAGSRHVTATLNAAGIPTCHEKTMSPPAWAGRNVLGEVSAHLVTEADTWPEAQVFHFTRHPQPFVSSLLRFGFWDVTAPLIHPFLVVTGDVVVDSFRFWIDWNALILAVPEPRRITFQVEEFDASVVRVIGRRLDIPEPAPGFAVRPWKETRDFHSCPASVEPEVRAMAERLGYTLQEPAG